MAYNSSYTGWEIDRAIGTLRKKESAWDNKQSKLRGSAGQIVGFDAQGQAVAQDFSGYNFADFVKAKVHNVTLPATSWKNKTQTVYIDGISAEEGAQLIQPVPASASFPTYAEAEIQVRQSLNQLEFSCKTPPVADIAMFIVIQDLNQREGE